MDWRHKELMAFGTDVASLDHLNAVAAYNRAMSLCSRTRYGLDESKFSAIEKLDVNETGTETGLWLNERIGNSELLLVFGEKLVFQVPAALFLANWRDMFCPSRDDVIILPVVGEWVLFYSHEDEFEFAWK